MSLPYTYGNYNTAAPPMWYYQQQQQQMIPPQQQPQQYIQQQQYMPAQQQQQILNGKIVDSEDVVKATEVPMGGYGVFPKADFSEIYIKSWNNNGTGTSVITFKPVTPEPQENNNNILELYNLLLQKVDSLETKLDTFFLNNKSMGGVVENNGF